MKNKGAIKLINWYKKEISPGLSPRCRYIPTCSEYAKECYEKFNFVKASLLVSRRLLRCNPFTKGGYDPVPLTRKEKLELEKLRQELEALKQSLSKADSMEAFRKESQRMTRSGIPPLPFTDISKPKMISAGSI